MPHRPGNIHVIVAIALAAAIASCAFAQEARVVASVDSTNVNVGDPVRYTLSLSVNGLRLMPDAELGNVNGFEVSGKESAQTYSNGQSQFQWIFILIPRQPGDLTIGSSTVRYGSTSIRTKAIHVNVAGTPASRAPASGTPATMPSLPSSGIDVKLTVDKPNPYVGEQVTLTFTLMQGASLYGSIGFEPPTAEGCVIEQLPSPETVRLLSPDREVVVIKRQWALFATGPGPRTIHPASITFRRDIGMQEEHLQSKSLTVNVRPLPTPPAGLNFGGAVGHFTINARADKAQLQAGEGANLTLTISGAGNLSSLEAPRPNLPAWCKLYPAGEKRDVAAKTAGGRSYIAGTATFNYLLVPSAEGQLRIDPIPLAYFDPATQQYQVVKTSPIELRVVGGNVAPDQSHKPGDLAAQMTGASGVFGHTPLPFRPWFLILNCIPLLVLAVALIQRAREIAVARDPIQARLTRAGRRAHRRLAAIRQVDKAALGELAAILRSYLADKLNLPEQGLLVDDFRRILLERGVEAEYVNRATETLEALHEAHFAPWNPDAQECADKLAQVRALIAEAERERLITGG